MKSSQLCAFPIYSYKVTIEQVMHMDDPIRDGIKLLKWTKRLIALIIFSFH